MIPLTCLSDVLILLRLQGKLDEHLLEFFVAVVDDELLKAVGLEDLKTVDIQHTHHLLLGLASSLRGLLDPQTLDQKLANK